MVSGSCSAHSGDSSAVLPTYSLSVQAVNTMVEYTEKLAKALKTEFKELFKANQSDADYSFDSVEMARRGLNHICITYLMRLQEEEVVNICLQQFK